jgi:hypothetical protein
MFPDMDRLEHNKALRGRAFSILVESKGIGVSRRSMKVDPQAWAQCVACERYRDCYDLSSAKLLLYMTLHGLT